jgi:hypothetical protein
MTKGRGWWALLQWDEAVWPSATVEMIVDLIKYLSKRIAISISKQFQKGNWAL